MSEQAVELPATSVTPQTQAAESIKTGTQVNIDLIGVRNQTPKRLTLKFESVRDGNHEITFAPLEKRWLSTSEERLRSYKELDSRGVILLEHKDQPIEPGRSSVDLSGLLSLLFLLLVGYFVGGGWVNENFQDYRLWYWISVPAVVIGIPILTFLTAHFGWTTVRRVTAQSMTLVLVMVIGLGLTTATIYFFGGVPALIQSGPSLTLLARTLQLTFSGIAALLPALLYYLFDRQQLGTLRARFESDIFKLDPTVKTLADIQVKYGGQLDELYGHDPTTSQGRLVSGTRWPILICTILVTAGWIMTMQPVGSDLLVNTPSELLAFFVPHFSMYTFGYLGAYYFALNMILRRYTRGDLQPKAYSHITVRIIIVAISAWVLEMLFGATNKYSYLLIFIIGIVPETFFTVIREYFKSNSVITRLLPQLEEKHPLTSLEGIDLYDRARLAEEGVTNIESLAHHDLIDLILATRIPISRLVDWLDQAILCLHLSEECEGEEDNKPVMQKTVKRLKRLGIRTATELENILQSVKDPNNRHAIEFLDRTRLAEEEVPSGESLLVNYLDGIDTKEGKGRHLMPSRIKTIYEAMQDDDWLNYIRHWRKSKEVLAMTITIEPNGEIIGQMN